MIQKQLAFLTLIICLLVSACQEKPIPPAPTLANPESVRTALAKTPAPAGFETISFDPLDSGRDALPNWHFQVTVSLSGQYTASGEPADSTLVMDVWENNIQRSRRVKLHFTGATLSGNVADHVEAVRFENDFYIVDGSSGVCLQNTEAAREIARLNAGQIVGGVTLAIPTGVAEFWGEIQAFQYGFGKDNLTINIFRDTPSAVAVTGGEVWVLPAYNVVGRFGVALNVHNARILFGDEPVTGTLHYTYELIDIAEPVEIALPNGC